MKKILKIIAAVMLLLTVFAGCGISETEKSEKLSVVTTAFPHYDFVRRIAGERVELTMLLKPGSEMHSYDPTPSDMMKISSCDVFVYTGGESDVWAKSILSSGAESDKRRIVSFTEICDPMVECNEEHEGHEEHETEYDEHVWTSPVNAKKLAKEIYNTLCEADEKNAEYYTERYEEFEKELEELDELFKKTVSEGKRNKIVVGDRFPFAHLAKEYSLDYIAAFPGCSAETEPSAKTVAELSETVKNEEIPVVFTVEFSNKKVAESIVAGTEAEIFTLHSCHNVTNDEFLSKITYVELMKKNAENLRKALN